MTILINRDTHILFIIALCLGATLLTACGKDDTGSRDTTPTTHIDGDANKWIYSTLTENYLWQDEVKQKSPNYDQDYDVFFKGILNPLTTNTDDGYFSNGSRQYLYSRISREDSSSASRSNQLTAEPEYGFGFTYSTWVYDREVSNSARCFVRIQYVEPNSPAATAGLKRGDWIGKINGSKIQGGVTSDGYVSNPNYALINKLFPAVGESVTLTKANFEWTTSNNSVSYTYSDTDETFHISASNMEINPIHTVKVITSTSGRKVGYMLYNSFRRGITETESKNTTEYEEQLTSIFTNWKSQGINDAVIDLRYNPGGYVETCRRMCSMLARSDKLGTTFAKYRYAGNVWKTNSFQKSSEVAGSNLNLSTVYVIATEDSASASEMVINALRGIDVTVVHIGGVTEGKNVGSSPFYTTIGGYYYTMWPITFQIYNAKEQSDYGQGFTPNYEVDDSRENNWYTFGDARELYLAKALSLINGTRFEASATTLANTDSMLRVELKHLRNPSQRGGAKLTLTDN